MNEPTPKDQIAPGTLVWFRMGRMYGYPPQEPMRAMVTRVLENGRVDLEIGCEGVSTAGEAGTVAHRDSLPPALREQSACYWL